MPAEVVSETMASDGAKRIAEEAAAGQSPAKALKTEVKDEVKDEIKDVFKDEIKAEVNKENSENSVKKEKKEHKEHKDKKDKKDKKEKKEKHKDKKETSDNGDADMSIVKKEPSLANDAEANKEWDQRKHFKAGQKFVTPPAADPTRGFYESLIEENPESKIAIKFCVENGIFAVEQHKKMFKKFMHFKEKGYYDARILMARTLEKSNKKESKEGKEKKDKKDKSEKKEKKDKEA